MAVWFLVLHLGRCRGIRADLFDGTSFAAAAGTVDASVAGAEDVDNGYTRRYGR